MQKASVDFCRKGEKIKCLVVKKVSIDFCKKFGKKSQVFLNKISVHRYHLYANIIFGYVRLYS